MKLLPLILLLLSFNLFAATLTVNPDKDSGFILICEDPTERVIGTPITQGEITDRKFYLYSDRTGWSIIGNQPSCEQLVTIANIADGVYYYTVVIHIGDLKSVVATDTDTPIGAWQITVKRGSVEPVEPVEPPVEPPVQNSPPNPAAIFGVKVVKK